MVTEYSKQRLKYYKSAFNTRAEETLATLNPPVEKKRTVAFDVEEHGKTKRIVFTKVIQRRYL